MPYVDFNKKKSSLTETDIDQLTSLLGYRCQLKTVQRIRSILTYHASSLPNFGIFGRLANEKNDWHYIAGQDYTSEIKTVRDCILGKIY